MSSVRKGRQTPTLSVVLPYTQSLGSEAVDLYDKSGRTAQDWQALINFRTRSSKGGLGEGYDLLIIDLRKQGITAPFLQLNISI